MPIAPPASVPLSAAMLRPSKAATAPDSRSHKGDVASPARASSRSAPAEKTFPSPVSTSTRASPAPSMISQSSSSIAAVSELAFSGRFRDTTQNVPSFVSVIISSPPFCEAPRRARPVPVQETGPLQRCTSRAVCARAIPQEYGLPSSFHSRGLRRSP